MLKTRLEPAEGEGTLCGTILDIESKNVKAFEQIILGGKLQERLKWQVTLNLKI